MKLMTQNYSLPAYKQHPVRKHNEREEPIVRAMKKINY